MAEYNDGIFSGVTLSNLSILSEEQSRTLELRVSELNQLACEAADFVFPLLRDGVGIVEALALLSEELLIPLAFQTTPLEENRQRAEAFFSSLSALDSATFSELLVSAIRHRGARISEADFLARASFDETFTYVKNSLADEAYDVLSQNFSDPRVAYSATQREACLGVVQGKVGYCILPLEERGGTRIPGIVSMLYAHDLKITSVTPVFGFEGTADMKYALISSGFDIPECNEGDDRYLELLISSSEDISRLCSSFSDMGAKLYRMSTLSVGASDAQESYYSVVLRRTGADFTELLAFLCLFCKDFIPIGLYKNLE